MTALMAPVILLLLGLCVGAASGPARAARESADAASIPLERFCSEAQKIVAKTRIEPENVIVRAQADFQPSKATIRPLSTRQFDVYADPARRQLVQISCKMKTVDHIRSEYGADAAGPEGLCADVNRRTLAEVLRGIPARERAALEYDRGRAVVFDPELVTTNGPEWLAPYPIAWRGTDGALHIVAKAQRNDWLDARYFAADPVFRGTRYCHLIAPDYLRRILRGEVEVGTTPPPPLVHPQIALPSN